MSVLGPRAARASLRVVLYHHIADQQSSLVDRLALTTGPAVFQAHVRRMARDYEVIGLDDVLAGKLPHRALLITFDDGYRSIADVALPFLRELGLPSVFFVTGACLRRDALPLDNLLSYVCATVGAERVAAVLGGEGQRPATFHQLLGVIAEMPYTRRLALEDELAQRFDVDRRALRAESGMFLDPEELAGLAAYDCEVANHTRSHVFCRAIEDETTAHTELVEHARALESLTGRPVRAFSYPYGRRADATPLVERVLRESGHQATFISESRSPSAAGSGQFWDRVTLDGCPAWRILPDIEIKPLLRVGRDRVLAARRRHAIAHTAHGPNIASSEYERSPTAGVSPPLK